MTEENKEINNLSDLSKLNESEENQVVQNEPKMDTLVIEEGRHRFLNQFFGSVFVFSIFF